MGAILEGKIRAHEFSGGLSDERVVHGARIVKLSGEHVFKVHHLGEECFQERWTTTQVERLIKHPASYSFGIFAGCDLNGFLLSFRTGAEVDIISIAIASEFRRQGCASALLNKIVQDPEILRVTLEVAVSNTAALAVYEKVGFKQQVVRKRYYHTGEDALLLVYGRQGL